MSCTTSYAKRNNAKLLDAAKRHGDHWTVADLEFLEAFRADFTNVELAEALGRTYSAICDKLAEIDRDGLAERQDRTSAAARSTDWTAWWERFASEL
jgi:hypothetical protein